MEKNCKILYVLSDATGELATNLAIAALRQFKQEGVAIARRARMRTSERIIRAVREAKDTRGFIIFTLVSPELRQTLLRTAADLKVPAIDVMGPVMENLARYLHASPSDQPGLQYQIDSEYLRRSDAIEFAVKHDDGLGLETIHQADIVLLGISRTSKTPLSIYLGYRGYKTANIPIIRGLNPPEELYAVDPRRLVGLTISAEKLAELRGTRLARLGRPVSGDYANIDAVREEVAYAAKIFKKLGNGPVIDVTAKAIEEVAAEILAALRL